MHNTKWNNAQCANGDQVEYNPTQIVRMQCKKVRQCTRGLQRLLKCTANALRALDALHFPSARFQTPTTLDHRLNYLRWHSINKGFPSPPAIYLNWHSIKQPIQWFTWSEFTWCFLHLWGHSLNQSSRRSRIWIWKHKSRGVLALMVDSLILQHNLSTLEMWKRIFFEMFIIIQNGKTHLGNVLSNFLFFLS